MITFDPISHRIILDSASITATELYSRWVDWVALSDNVKYGVVLRQVGSDDLGSGLSIPPYYFLQGSWRIRPMEANHNLTITGNLFVEGGGIPVVQTLGAFQVNVNYTVPVQAQGISTSGSTGPSASEIAAAVIAALGDIGGGSSPSAVTVAKAVRTELSSELSKLDARISTRLEQGTVPANMISINGRPLKGSGTKTDPWVAA